MFSRTDFACLRITSFSESGVYSFGADLSWCTPHLTQCNPTFISFFLFSVLVFHFSYFFISSHFLTGSLNVHVIVGRCQLRHRLLQRPLHSPAQSTSHYPLHIFIILAISYIIGDLLYHFIVSLHLTDRSPRRGPQLVLSGQRPYL